MLSHQYIERRTSRIIDEKLYADRVIQFLYSQVREHAAPLFRAFTSCWATKTLGSFNFDLPLCCQVERLKKFMRRAGVDFSECLVPESELTTARKIFERQIRYWECRPMNNLPAAIVSPADALLLVGSLAPNSTIFLKNKFFTYEELLGLDRSRWLSAFRGGEIAIFRLTPDKYHYNHLPVSGRIIDFYELQGDYHSCNPGAVVREVTPFSKNRRVVTIIDTDCEGGSQVGLAAMVEVVALMIGEIVQCYSSEAYNNPCQLEIGMMVQKGQPKSLYRPGSSTDILLFQRGKVLFYPDLLANRKTTAVHSRFSTGFSTPMVETEVAVRSSIALGVGSLHGETYGDNQ